MLQFKGYHRYALIALFYSLVSVFLIVLIQNIKILYVEYSFKEQWVSSFPQWVIAFFTVVGSFFSFYAVVLLKDTLKEVVLNHPPRLKVGTMHIWVKGEGGMLENNKTPALCKGDQIQGGILVSNFGRDKATIIASDCMFYWMRKGAPLPMSRPFFGDRKNSVNWCRLGKDGEWGNPVCEMPPGTNAGWLIDTVVPNSNMDLWIIGYIVFNDKVGTRRKTVFSRKFDRDRDGFFAEEKPNPDYECEE